ncbi:fatty acid desaturase [Zavarzinia aquatilis]|uniref:Uncharacterized protein n=1 Tax=Zavarzinia aquatilis TaxID=2211142 RepID=A0A317DVM1_9PROT|nr:fatty acid desaturase [Zavarzinia aquatilis]PWR18424.1 hypothetical protein DKG74_19455 [Zavarzinia aquatilis]
MQAQASADWGLAARARSTPSLQDLHVLPLFPVPTLALLTGCIAGFGLSGWAMVTGVLHPAIAIAISSVLVYASFTVLHDGTHRAISRSPLLNDIIGTLGGQFLLPGIEVAVYRHLHLEHHKSTGEHGDDPDDILVAPLPGVLPALFFIDIIWFFWYVRRFNRWTALQNSRFLLGFSLYVAWHVAWIASPYAYEWLLVWLLPQRLGLGITTYLFAHIQHPPGVEQREHPIHATVMIERNPLVLSFMLGQSAHLIHHLYPQLPFYRLEAGWRAAERLLAPRGVLFRGLVESEAPTLPEAEQPWRRARVTAVEDIANGIRLFTLARADGGDLPGFEAGAHVDLRLDPHRVRQYSLIGVPGQAGTWQIGVKREAAGRGGSIAVHERLVTGAEIEVGRPRSHFPLRDGGGRHVLIAGGIGMTPLISMAHALQGRDFTLHLFARDAAGAPFGASFARFPFAARIQPHYDEGKGFSDGEIAAAIGPWHDGDRIHLCGPGGFMDRVKAVAFSLGWPADAVSTENFSPVPLSPGEAFTVTLARSGKRIEVAAGAALTDALEAARLPVDTLCRRGICGTCRCKVISGTIEHRDSVLTDEERASGQHMIPCVSRGTGKDTLVLDL